MPSATGAADQVPTKFSGLPPLKFKLVAGGAAGPLTCTGIAVGDTIVSVQTFGLTEGAPNTFSGITDQTSEFSVSAANTITNAGGTSTAGKLLLVVWYARTTGR